MKTNDNKKSKLSLTGSLASLAREVQNDVPDKEIVNETEKSVEVTRRSVSKKAQYSWDEVLEIALALKSSPPKTATVYIYENVKKDVEALKRIDGLENVPLTALISAMIEHFLNANTDKIKELVANSSSRF